MRSSSSWPGSSTTNGATGNPGVGEQLHRHRERHDRTDRRIEQRRRRATDRCDRCRRARCRGRRGELVERFERAVRGPQAPAEHDVAVLVAARPVAERGRLHGRHDQRDRRVLRDLGKGLEQGAAPGLVALTGPPTEHQRVDEVGARVALEQLAQPFGITHHEPGHVERVAHAFARHALAHPVSQLVEGRELDAGVLRGVGGDAGDTARRRHHRHAPHRSAPLGWDLGEQLREVEQVVDVVRGEDAGVAEHQLVDPALVGDGAGVRAHDLARAFGAAELRGRRRQCRRPGRAPPRPGICRRRGSSRSRGR